MSTKRSRARRHSISSLEEAAKRAAQEPSDSTAIMPTTTQQAETVMSAASDARFGKAKKRPLPIDPTSLASDVNPAKKFAMLAGGLSMEDLLKNAAQQTPGEGADQQYLFLPGGS